MQTISLFSKILQISNSNHAFKKWNKCLHIKDPGNSFLFPITKECLIFCLTCPLHSILVINCGSKSQVWQRLHFGGKVLYKCKKKKKIIKINGWPGQNHTGSGLNRGKNLVFKFERNMGLVFSLLPWEKLPRFIFVNITQFSFLCSCSYWSTWGEIALWPNKSKYRSLLPYRLSGFILISEQWI